MWTPLINTLHIAVVSNYLKMGGVNQRPRLTDAHGEGRSAHVVQFNKRASVTQTARKVHVSFDRNVYLIHSESQFVAYEANCLSMMSQLNNPPDVSQNLSTWSWGEAASVDPRGWTVCSVTSPSIKWLTVSEWCTLTCMNRTADKVKVWMPMLRIHCLPC